jgi:hypothetical protein
MWLYWYGRPLPFWAPVGDRSAPYPDAWFSLEAVS